MSTSSVLTPAQITDAVPGALRKLDPRALWATPVMLLVEIGAVATTILSIFDPSVMGWMVTIWLWLTVLFGTLAESVAEGRGKAQAASLRALQTETNGYLDNNLSFVPYLIVLVVCAVVIALAMSRTKRKDGR